ncbi:MAG TPA: phage baseplate assembly protein V [Thermoanaerobaculia bacterium]|nr:phage baseplate assembly protein V [Thermoanaerobaculia bacterium]
MEELLVQVAREVQRKYYGKYRGFVVDDADPEKRGRLRVRVPSVIGGEETAWALPCIPYGGGAGYGFFAVPPVDSQVWVEFEEGELAQPVWTGTFWQQQGDPPAEATAGEKPTAHVLKTPAEHLLVLDDEKDKEKIRLVHKKGTEIAIDEKGILTLTDSGGSVVTLDPDAGKLSVEDSNGNTLTMTSSGTTVEDANGNKVEMASAGISVEGQKVVIKGSSVMLGGDGGEPIIKGQSFLQLFMTHMHPTAMGPSGPPIPQGEMSTLSTKVLTS